MARTNRRRGRIGGMVGAALIVGAALVGGLALEAQEHVGEYARADIEFGARLYNDNCLTCHGVNGDAISGVNLRSGQFRRAATDRDLTRIIRTGIPDTAMPPGQYTQAELSGLVAFIRTMGEVDPATLTLGDAARGEGVFTGKGACLDCHRVGARGSRKAPDLTDVGGSRSAGAIEQALLDPTGSMLPVNRPIRAVTNDGTEINGRRLNEDTFTIQIIDQDERLRSLDKADLRELTVVMTSPMPNYGDRLTDQELSDLLAYLMTLKGV